MRARDFDDVRALPLFREMAEASFARLMRGAYVQTFPPQVELIAEGDTADFLHVVIEGTVELYASWNRRETTMATLDPVTTFILAATIKDAPYLMAARTIEKSRIVLLPSEDVRTIFADDEAFARAIVIELANGYRGVVKNLKGLKLRTSIERLANYLLRRHADTGARSEFDLAIEKRRLASFLGMTPENLSRAIKALRPYGVAIDGARVRIEKPADLKRLAKPSPLIDDPSR